jgi:hypothetical protein
METIYILCMMWTTPPIDPAWAFAQFETKEQCEMGRNRLKDMPSMPTIPCFPVEKGQPVSCPRGS